MSSNRNVLLGAASALVLLGATAAMAQNDANVTIVEPGATERAGDAVENAGEAAGEAVRTTGEAAQDAAQAVTPGQEADEAEVIVEQEGEAEVTVETVEPEQGATTPTFVEGVIDQQSTEDELASALMNANVVNNAGEEIGHINDMIIGPDGQIRGVVIGVGGFLGIGEKDVAIERSTLQESTDDDGDPVYVLNATVEELESAPDFRTREDIEREAAQTPGGPAGTGGSMGTGGTMQPGTGTGTGTAQ